MNFPSRYEQFLALVVQIGAERRHTQDYELYERLKRELVRDCPEMSPQEYARAIATISGATGINRK